MEREKDLTVSKQLLADIEAEIDRALIPFLPRSQARALSSVIRAISQLEARIEVLEQR
jgi:hypothetical protein